MLTNGRVVYLDSSALVKLVVREDESVELARFLKDYPHRVSSQLALTEVTRAVLDHGPDVVAKAEAVLADVDLLLIDVFALRRAGHLLPIHMRSLDAIHLASALELESELELLITYDVRLADAARLHGIAVVAPAASD